MWTYFGEGGTKFTDAMSLHHKSVSTVMPIQYVLDVTGHFSCVVAPFNESHNASDCPVWDARTNQLHKLGLATVPTITLPPGYVGTGVKLLLSSEMLQSQFISDAVAVTVAKKHSGLCIDFENSGGHTGKQLAAFLAKLATALHAQSKTLVCAFNSGFLSPSTLKGAGMDRLQDMNTYSASLNSRLIKSHMAEVGGPDKYCYGLDPSLPPGYSSRTVVEQVKLARELGVIHICVWEDHEKDVPAEMWEALECFLYDSPLPTADDDDQPLAPTPPPTPLPCTCVDPNPCRRDVGGYSIDGMYDSDYVIEHPAAAAIDAAATAAVVAAAAAAAAANTTVIAQTKCPYGCNGNCPKCCPVGGSSCSCANPMGCCNRYTFSHTLSLILSLSYSLSHALSLMLSLLLSLSAPPSPTGPTPATPAPAPGPSPAEWCLPRSSATHQCPAGSTDCPASTPVYIGCYSERTLSASYFTQVNAFYITDSATPTQFHKSAAVAKQHGGKYFALAHVNPKSGFGFVFNGTLPGKPDGKGSGCSIKCSDDRDVACGCGDDGYTMGCPVTTKGATKDKTTRRWAVYRYGR
jgi:hypothetical protein